MAWSNFNNSMHNEGGYMDTSANMSIGGSEDKQNLKRGQNCIPIVIAQLIRHGEKLTIWGIPAKIVTLVGIVRKVESLAAKMNFELQDETGSISCVKWLETGTDYKSPVEVNNYARVYGLIRSNDDTPFVLILSIQPIEHLNELLAHLMEVTLVSLQGEKMVNVVAKGDGYTNNSMLNQSNMDSNSNASGLTGQQQLVLDIIQSSDPEYGAERDAIKQQVPPSIVSKVDDIIEFLSAEGHIYTTKTDDFFKAI